MSTNHQPATPLPWVAREQGDADSFALLTADGAKWVVAFRLNGEQTLPQERQNIAYLVHAAHAYQKLVPELREAVESCQCTVKERASGHRSECRAPVWLDLLRDLGEA